MSEETELYGIVNEAGEILGSWPVDGKYKAIFKAVGEKRVLRDIIVASDPSDLTDTQRKWGGTIVSLRTMKPVNMIECRYDEETEIISWHRIGEARAMVAICLSQIQQNLFDFAYCDSRDETIAFAGYRPDVPCFDIKARRVYN